MERRKARENAFIAVFEASFSRNYIEDILATTQEMPEYEEYMLDDFALRLVNNYYEHADEVNEMVQSKLVKWDAKRIPRVCNAILCLSAAEMMYMDEATDSTIINEAVELCKKYAGDNDYQFVNGVLGAVSRELKGEERED